MRALKFILPLVLFAVIAGFLLKGLDRDPREVPSPLIGKPAPAASIPMLSTGSAAGDGTTKVWSPADMRGQVWLLNVWGSWCAACQVEHPLLNEWARRKIAPVVGFAWKDAPEASQAWLTRLGNPYVINVSDRAGRAAIDWGVYGAPETFVIDKAGIIRDKHIGPLTAEIIERRLIPLIAKLNAQ